MVQKPLERPLLAVFCTYSVFCMIFMWDWFENLKSPIFVYKFHFFQHLTMDDPWRAITRRDLSSIIWRMWRPYIARPYGTVCQLIYHSYYRRLPVRKDTCRIAAISLNMQEKVHPVIWSLDNLPFDCQKTLPVPKPNGNGFQLQLIFRGFLYYFAQL